MKHTIWSSNIGNLSDWKDYLDEYYPDANETEQYEAVYALNNDYLDDERINLNIPCSILAIADLGFWNGRTTGYAFFENIKDILTSNSDDTEWFVEGNELKAIMYHHDGINYVTYYLLNEIDGYDDFQDEVRATYGDVDQELFNKYCNAKALADKVKAVYGWD